MALMLMDFGEHHLRLCNISSRFGPPVAGAMAARTLPPPQVLVLLWEFGGERAGVGACGTSGQSSSGLAITHPWLCSRATGDRMCHEESAKRALHCPPPHFFLLLWFETFTRCFHQKMLIMPNLDHISVPQHITLHRKTDFHVIRHAVNKRHCK